MVLARDFQPSAVPFTNATWRRTQESSERSQLIRSLTLPLAPFKLLKQSILGSFTTQHNDHEGAALQQTVSQRDGFPGGVREALIPAYL